MKRIYDKNLDNTYVEGQLNTLQTGLDECGVFVICNTSIDYDETLTYNLADIVPFEFEMDDYMFLVSAVPQDDEFTLARKLNTLCEGVNKVSESDSWIDIGERS